MTQQLRLETRFWSKVDKRGPDDCWLWTGATAPKDGRGRFLLNGKNRTAPRAAWIIANGAEPTGLVCHTCDNPLCVNLSHLWIGTNRDNMIDSVRKGRHRLASRTHCKNGHEFSTENMRVQTCGGSSYRRCVACDKARSLSSRGRSAK